MPIDRVDFDEFRTLIEHAGWLRTDFTLSFEEDEHPLDAIHLIRTTVTVVFEPTGRSQSYDAGDGSAWLADFDADLRSGFYSTQAKGQAT